MPFSWGAAASLPFLPRLRYGRTVLAPARWNLTAADLPPTGSDWNAWRAALARWRQRFRLPDLVYLVEADNLLPLDLAENAHQELLRAHLNRHGYARLDEAPPPGVFGWLDGHAHEIAIPLTSTVPGRKTPHLARVRMIESGDGHLPGTAPWLYAKLYTSPGRLIELLGQVPDLIADWDEVTEWWYLPYRDPDPHVRLRIRLPDVDAYGSATVRVGDWVARLRRHRLVGRLQLDTYHPETGRYGHGQAMTAAEQVFAADSAAALAELRAAAANAAPLDAFAAASLVAIVLSFIGDTDRGSEPTDRAVHATTMRLADPTDDWSHLRAVDRAGTVMNAWRQRRAALAAYRDQLTPQCDPLTVLPSLLHLHSIRLHGVDPDRERLARRLARAAAMRWSALRPGKTG
jgi:thiopeptide-type bacteriocin biosynthesis protein